MGSFIDPEHNLNELGGGGGWGEAGVFGQGKSLISEPSVKSHSFL